MDGWMDGWMEVLLDGKRGGIDFFFLCDYPTFESIPFTWCGDERRACMNYQLAHGNTSSGFSSSYDTILISCLWCGEWFEYKGMGWDGMGWGCLI
jgi:hypothetical protein